MVKIGNVLQIFSILKKSIIENLGSDYNFVVVVEKYDRTKIF